jgi:vacuolar protein-sorting-associated protein 4
MENPNVPWERVAGLETAKGALTDAILLPLQQPQLFEEGGGPLKAARGILLYGPPGTGKTHLAKAVATEMFAVHNGGGGGGGGGGGAPRRGATKGGAFLSVQASDIMSKWKGESVKNIKAMFSIAKENKPAVVRFPSAARRCARRANHPPGTLRSYPTHALRFSSTSSTRLAGRGGAGTSTKRTGRLRRKS